MQMENIFGYCTAGGDEMMKKKKLGEKKTGMNYEETNKARYVDSQTKSRVWLHRLTHTSLLSQNCLVGRPCRPSARFSIPHHYPYCRILA